MMDDDEQRVVDDMIKKASRFGLQDEVKFQYGLYRDSGDTPEQAATAALYEWDII